MRKRSVYCVLAVKDDVEDVVLVHHNLTIVMKCVEREAQSFEACGFDLVVVEREPGDVE